MEAVDKVSFGFKTKALPLVLLVLLSSCIASKKNDKGLFDYSYCIAHKGLPSRVLDITNVALDTRVLFEAKTLIEGEPLPVSIELYHLGKNERNRYVADENGRLDISIEAGVYSLSAKFIGFEDLILDSVVISQSTQTRLTLGMGISGGYTTLGIQSKRRMMKFELAQYARRWRRSLYKSYRKANGQL